MSTVGWKESSGALLLWSTTPIPAPEIVVQRLLERGVLTDGVLRLVVLQTPLDEPRAAEVDILREQFAVQGVQVTAIDPGVQTREDAFREDVLETLRDAHIVLATGGQPERMMEVVRGTPALTAMQEVLDRGGIVGGGSAGAMVFGAGMPARTGRCDFLAWTPFVVAPHFGNYPLDRWQAEFRGHQILGLPDTAVAIVQGATITSAGRAPLVVLDVDTGAEQVLAPGEHLPLAR